ncbi:uncharacterized protein LOC142357053, partial [Convolutriloba macropyga]|uniref:uncharacterized protein LOC142357053 n=1 Tax=Convolutriloba macropyga TaxID=536237 RepID=UPI003F520B92
MLSKLNPDMSFSLFLEGPQAYRGSSSFGTSGGGSVGGRASQMERLACSANGSLHRVPKETMIRAQVAKLINFLSNGSSETERMMVWSRVYPSIWSPFHRPVLTLSTPVFYTPTPAIKYSSQWYTMMNGEQMQPLPSILGVVGQDVHLDIFHKWMDQAWIKPHAQVFLVNSDTAYVSMMRGIENIAKLNTEVFPEIPLIDVVPEILSDSEIALLRQLTQFGTFLTQTFQTRLSNIPGHQYLSR